MKQNSDEANSDDPKPQHHYSSSDQSSQKLTLMRYILITTNQEATASTRQRSIFLESHLQRFIKLPKNNFSCLQRIYNVCLYKGALGETTDNEQQHTCVQTIESFFKKSCCLFSFNIV